MKNRVLLSLLVTGYITAHIGLYAGLHTIMYRPQVLGGSYCLFATILGFMVTSLAVYYYLFLAGLIVRIQLLSALLGLGLVLTYFTPIHNTPLKYILLMNGSLLFGTTLMNFTTSLSLSRVIVLSKKILILLIPVLVIVLFFTTVPALVEYLIPDTPVLLGGTVLAPDKSVKPIEEVAKAYVEQPTTSILVTVYGGIPVERAVVEGDRVVLDTGVGRALLSRNFFEHLRELGNLLLSSGENIEGFLIHYRMSGFDLWLADIYLGIQRFENLVLGSATSLLKLLYGVLFIAYGVISRHG